MVKKGDVGSGMPKKIEDIRIGFVMPIASTVGYSDGHWFDVMSILDSVADSLGITKRDMVSNGDNITTIHSRIVNNLYHDDIVICDVSSRNPNVMFELGMRIAFDKPVIIIKDSDTDYCFDSGTIEHLPYPKDLRYAGIKKFKEKLSEKIKSTFEIFINNENHDSPILKNFGSFDLRDVTLGEFSAQELMLSNISDIKNLLVRMQSSYVNDYKKDKNIIDSRRIVRLPEMTRKQLDLASELVIKRNMELRLSSNGSYFIPVSNNEEISYARRIIEMIKND